MKNHYIQPDITTYPIPESELITSSKDKGYAIDGGNVIPIVEKEEEDSLFIIID